MINPLDPDKSDINSASPEEQSRVKHLSGVKSSLEQVIEKYHWEGLKHEYIRGITLVQAGFSKEELEGKFTVSELRDDRCKAGQLDTAGYSIADLKNGGFKIRELEQGGFKWQEILHDPEENPEGFKAADLNAEQYTAKKLKGKNCTLLQLKKAEFSPKELHKAGFTWNELLYEKGANEEGYKAAELKNQGITDIEELVDLEGEGDHVTARRLIEVGFAWKEILYLYDGSTKQGRFTAEHLTSSKGDYFNLKELRETFHVPDEKLYKAGFSAKEFIKEGLKVRTHKGKPATLMDYTANLIWRDENAKENTKPANEKEDYKKNKRCTIEDFRTAGFPWDDLLANAEEPPIDRGEGCFTAQEIKDYKGKKYTVALLRKEKAAGDRMIKAGYTYLELMEGGYLARKKKKDLRHKLADKELAEICTLEKVDEKNPEDREKFIKACIKARFPARDLAWKARFSFLEIMECGYKAKRKTTQKNNRIAGLPLITILYMRPPGIEYGKIFEDLKNDPGKEEELIRVAKACRKAGFAGRELVRAGFTRRDLLAAFTPEIGYESAVETVRKLRDNSFNLWRCTPYEIVQAGFEASELLEAGCGKKEICQGCGYKSGKKVIPAPEKDIVPGLILNGCDPIKLRRAGFDLTKERIFIPNTDLIHAGYRKPDLVHLRKIEWTEQEGAGGEKKIKVEVNAPQKTEEGHRFYNDEICMLAAEGIRPGQFARAGFTWEELRDAYPRLISTGGYYQFDVDAVESNEGAPAEGADAWRIDKRKTGNYLAAFTGAELIRAGLRTKDFREKRKLKKEWKGFTAAELRMQGCDARNLKQAGFTGKDLVTANWHIDQANKNKEGKIYRPFLTLDLEAAGFDAKKLKKEGVGGPLLLKSGFFRFELESAGFKVSDLLGKDIEYEDVEDPKGARKKETDGHVTAGMMLDVGYQYNDLKDETVAGKKLKELVEGDKASYVEGEGRAGEFTEDQWETWMFLIEREKEKTEFEKLAEVKKNFMAAAKKRFRDRVEKSQNEKKLKEIEKRLKGLRSFRLKVKTWPPIVKSEKSVEQGGEGEKPKVTRLKDMTVEQIDAHIKNLVAERQKQIADRKEALEIEREFERTKIAFKKQIDKRIETIKKHLKRIEKGNGYKNRINKLSAARASRQKEVEEKNKNFVKNKLNFYPPRQEMADVQLELRRILIGDPEKVTTAKINIPPSLYERWWSRINDWQMGAYYSGGEDGDPVSYVTRGGAVYKCKETHITVEFNADDAWEKLGGECAAFSSSVDALKLYAKGEYVLHEGDAFACLTHHKVAAQRVFMAVEPEVPEWNAETEYDNGQFVKTGGICYRCIEKNQGKNPEEDDTSWLIVDYEDKADLCEKDDPIWDFENKALLKCAFAGRSDQDVLDCGEFWKKVDKGEWASSGAYAKGDVVSDEGEKYVCNKETSVMREEDVWKKLEDKWTLLVEGGQEEVWQDKAYKDGDVVKDEKDKNLYVFTEEPNVPSVEKMTARNRAILPLEDLVLLDEVIRKVDYEKKEYEAEKKILEDYSGLLNNVKDVWGYVNGIENLHKVLRLIAYSITTVAPSNPTEWIVSGVTKPEASLDFFHRGIGGEMSFAFEVYLGVGAVGFLGKISVMVSGVLSMGDDRAIESSLSIGIAPSFEYEVDNPDSFLHEQIAFSISLGLTFSFLNYTFVDEDHFAYYMAFRIINFINLFRRRTFQKYEHKQYNRFFCLYDRDVQELMRIAIKDEQKYKEMEEYLTEKEVLFTNLVEGELAGELEVPNVSGEASATAGYKWMEKSKLRLMSFWEFSAKTDDEGDGLYNSIAFLFRNCGHNLSDLSAVTRDEIKNLVKEEQPEKKHKSSGLRYRCAKIANTYQVDIEMISPDDLDSNFVETCAPRRPESDEDYKDYHPLRLYLIHHDSGRAQVFNPLLIAKSLHPEPPEEGDPKDGKIAFTNGVENKTPELFRPIHARPAQEMDLPESSSESTGKGASGKAPSLHEQALAKRELERSFAPKVIIAKSNCAFWSVKGNLDLNLLGVHVDGEAELACEEGQRSICLKLGGGLVGALEFRPAEWEWVEDIKVYDTDNLVTMIFKGGPDNTFSDQFDFYTQLIGDTFEQPVKWPEQIDALGFSLDRRHYLEWNISEEDGQIRHQGFMFGREKKGGVGTFVFQNRKTVYSFTASAGLDVKVTIEGVDIAAGASFEFTKSVVMAETLGTNTLTYLQTVFNGLKERDVAGNKKGYESWKKFLQEHRVEVCAIFKRIGEESKRVGENPHHQPKQVFKEVLNLEQKANDSAALITELEESYCSGDERNVYAEGNGDALTAACRKMIPQLSKNMGWTLKHPFQGFREPAKETLDVYEQLCRKLTALMWLEGEEKAREEKGDWKFQFKYLEPPAGSIKFVIAWNGEQEFERYVVQEPPTLKTYKKEDASLIDVLKDPFLADAMSALPFYHAGFEVKLTVLVKTYYDRSQKEPELFSTLVEPDPIFYAGGQSRLARTLGPLFTWKNKREVGITLLKKGTEEPLDSYKVTFKPWKTGLQNTKNSDDRDIIKSKIEDVGATISKDDEIEARLESAYMDKKLDPQRLRGVETFIRDTAGTINTSDGGAFDSKHLRFLHFVGWRLTGRDVGVSFVDKESNNILGTYRLLFSPYESSMKKTDKRDPEILADEIEHVKRLAGASDRVLVKLNSMNNDKTFDPRRVEAVEEHVQKHLSGATVQAQIGERDVRIAFFEKKGEVSADTIQEDMKDGAKLTFQDSCDVWFPPNVYLPPAEFLGLAVDKMSRIKERFEKKKVDLDKLVVVLQKSRIKNSFQNWRLKSVEKLVRNYFRYGATTVFFKPDETIKVRIKGARRPDGEAALERTFIELVRKATREPASLDPIGTTKKQMYINLLDSFSRIHPGLHKAMKEYVEKLKKDSEQRAVSRSKRAKGAWKPVDVTDQEEAVKGQKKVDLPKPFGKRDVQVAIFKIPDKGGDVLFKTLRVRFNPWQTTMKTVDQVDLKVLKKWIIKTCRSVTDPDKVKIRVQLDASDHDKVRNYDRMRAVNEYLTSTFQEIGEKGKHKVSLIKPLQLKIRKSAPQRNVKVTFIDAREEPGKKLFDHYVSFKSYREKINEKQTKALQEAIDKAKQTIGEGVRGLKIRVGIDDKKWHIDPFYNDPVRLRNVKRAVEEYLRYGGGEGGDELLQEAEEIFDRWVQNKDDRTADGTIVRNPNGIWWDRFEEILNSLQGPFIGFHESTFGLKLTIDKRVTDIYLWNTKNPIW